MSQIQSVDNSVMFVLPPVLYRCCSEIVPLRKCSSGKNSLANMFPRKETASGAISPGINTHARSCSGPAEMGRLLSRLISTC